MTGYDRDEHRDVYRVTFEDGPLAGFEFSARAPSYAGEVAALRVALAEAPGVPPERWLLALAPLLEDLGHQLYRWNLVRRGRRVPATGAEVLRLDRPMLTEMLAAWSAALHTPVATEQPTAVTESDAAEAEATLLAELDIPQEPLPAPAPAHEVEPIPA